MSSYVIICHHLSYIYHKWSWNWIYVYQLGKHPWVKTLIAVETSLGFPVSNDPGIFSHHDNQLESCWESSRRNQFMALLYQMLKNHMGHIPYMGGTPKNCHHPNLNSTESVTLVHIGYWWRFPKIGLPPLGIILNISSKIRMIDRIPKYFIIILNMSFYHHPKYVISSPS